MKRIIGFNTLGFMDDDLRISKTAIDFIRSLGCNAIELSPFDIKGLNMLGRIERSYFQGFDYVSLHAPLSHNSSEKLTMILGLIQHHHRRLNFDTIVLHPSDIEDFDSLKDFELPLAFENMDWRKSEYKNADEMNELIESINTPMVFDIQHAYSNDMTGRLADEFCSRLLARIVEVHLSGIDDAKEHCLLYEKNQSGIIRKIPMHIPIIIESDKPKKDLSELAVVLKKELDYITLNLSNPGQD